MATKKPASPTHYAIVLKQPFPVPGTAFVVPAGASTTAAEIVEQIPADLFVGSKTPVEA